MVPVMTMAHSGFCQDQESYPDLLFSGGLPTAAVLVSLLSWFTSWNKTERLQQILSPHRPQIAHQPADDPSSQDSVSHNSKSILPSNFRHVFLWCCCCCWCCRCIASLPGVVEPRSWAAKAVVDWLVKPRDDLCASHAQSRHVSYFTLKLIYLLARAALVPHPPPPVCLSVRITG